MIILFWKLDPSWRLEPDSREIPRHSNFEIPSVIELPAMPTLDVSELNIVTAILGK